MTLQAELDAFKGAWLDRVGPEIARLVEDDNASLARSQPRQPRPATCFPQ